MPGTDSCSRTIERRAETLRILALVLLCGALYFAFLDSRPLWNVDEGMHSATSKEMVLTGDWITPHHNGEPFYDKTALHNWFVALSLMLFGFTEAAARLPAALLGLGTVLITYWMGRRMYGKWAGFFGAVVLASSIQVIVLSQTIVHDTSLYFFVTLALALFYRGYSATDGGGKWFLFSCAALGFAILAKGPVGLLLPGGIIFWFLVFRRDLRFLGKMQLHWGVPLGLLIAVPWFVAIATINADYVQEFFVRLHLGSLGSKAANRVNHPEPWYYYIRALFGGFAPWSVFLPGAIWFAWRNRKEDGRGATVFLFVWAGLFLLFFSSAKSKLATYILPMYPAVALLTGRLWAEVATREVPAAAARRWLQWSILSFASLPIAAIWFLSRPDSNPEKLKEWYGVEVWVGATPIIALFVCLAAAAVLLWMGRTRLAFAGVATSVAACLTLFVLLIVPVMNPYQTSRDVAYELDRRMPEGEEFVQYHRLRDSVLFYSDRKVKVIRWPGPLRKLLAGDKRVYVLISPRHYGRLEFDLPILMTQGEDLLISNREDP